MADHSKPLLTSTYPNFVSELDARFDDISLMLDPAYTSPSNLPTNSIRWSSAANKWQKWNGTTWGELSSTFSLTSITLSGGLTSAGDIEANSGNLTSTQTSGTIYNTNVTTLDFAGAATTLNVGSNTGTVTLKNPNIQTTVTSGTLNLFAALTSGVLNIGSANTGKIQVLFNSDSSSSTTGSVVTAGGLGVGGISYFAKDVYLSGTGALKVPVGTEAQRPTGAAGKIRLNSDTSKFEGHDGTAWKDIGSTVLLSFPFFKSSGVSDVISLLNNTLLPFTNYLGSSKNVSVTT